MTVTDGKDQATPAETEAADPVQSSSDTDMLRRVRDLLIEAP